MYILVYTLNLVKSFKWKDDFGLKIKRGFFFPHTHCHYFISIHYLWPSISALVFCYCFLHCILHFLQGK